MSDYILVVDDDPYVQGLLLDALESFGLVGTGASNGQQALDLIRQDPPTLIILDLVMPIMDGFTTLTRLQADPTSRDIPIIVLSALTDYQPQIKTLPGVVATLAKSDFSMTYFRQVLSQAGV